MPTTYTPRAQLGISATGDTGYGVPVAANWTALDGTNAVGALAVTLTEVPSETLNVAVAGGSFRNSWGSIVTYAGTASQALSATETSYLYLLESGGVVASVLGWPTGTFYVPLAVVVTGASTITSITDARLCYGTVNSQSQPTMGAQTASGTYGATEAAMLNAVYSAVRAMGLGT